MNDAMSNVDEPEQRRLLRIVSGLHAGASRELAEREMILVGSGDDCDIVLADAGVATRHALISVVDGQFQLRALDAPLQLEGRLLHPGDPVEMDRLQRVGLGEAALAFGLQDDPAWLALAPDGDQPAASRARRLIEPLTRRLPLFAAVAVLGLASLAIIVAVVPEAESRIDPEARLLEIARQYGVSERKIERDVSNQPVLVGMVNDAATRRQIQQQIEEEALPVSLALSIGEDMAINVGELLRSGGFPAKTRYLGRGEVEATGYFEDMQAFEAYVRTPAVLDTGVRLIRPINLAEEVEEAEAPELEAVRIVAHHRGDDPHLVDEDGKQYRAGEFIPGEGTLSALGRVAMVATEDGTIKTVEVRPVTAEEKKRRETATAAQENEDTPAPARSRAWAAEQARAAGNRQ
ncbi:FHA domain-containing protein [Luteimonas dalianensis]|uniref:FHA domain-containing protein n=1 Tax=Luteimonas dalianensis TaxID=1148196 RepID=UPI003BF2515A